MGCSQAKAARPSTPAAHADPSNTLLTTTSGPNCADPLKVEAEDVMSKLKQLFTRMDVDRSGYVDAKELAASLENETSLVSALEAAGLNSKWYVLEQMDADQDGKITWEEFQSSLENKSVSKVELDVQESSTATPGASKDWPLRWKALQVYVLAKKETDGHLGVQYLSTLSNDVALAGMLQALLRFQAPPDSESLSRLSFSQTEWLQATQSAWNGDPEQLSSFLDVCLQHIKEETDSWPLRERALEVFNMADSNGDGHLNMDELTDIRRSAEFAQAMMGNIDVDKDGVVSRGEWLAYVKRLADQNEKSASAVLDLYAKHLKMCSERRAVKEEVILGGGQNAEKDIVVEGDDGKAVQRWWACC